MSDLQKFRKKKKEAMAVARVDHQDLKILQDRGLSVSSIIQDAISKAADEARALSATERRKLK